MKSKTITTTRFNNETFQQNKNYVNKTGIRGCIYGTPMKMKCHRSAQGIKTHLPLHRLPTSHQQSALV